MVRKRRRRRLTIPPPKHVCIITLYVPEFVDIGVWIKDLVKEYKQTKECFPPTKYIQEQIYNVYGKHNTHISKLKVKMTYSEALKWMSSESFDISLEYRNVDYKVCPEEVYCNYIVYNKLWRCSICLSNKPVDTIKIRNCNCLYHKACFLKSYAYSKKCPICYNDVEIENIYEPLLEVVV